MSHGVGPPAAVILSLLLAACGSVPVASQLPAKSSAAAFNGSAAVAAVRGAGSADGRELDVRPLRDPHVEDLREQAVALEAHGMHLAAADALDAALAINGDDPALLQERAEVALLLGQLPDAERYAQRAFSAGSRVGPLCRRHWETIAQVRAARGVPLASPAPVPATAVDPTPGTAADARRQRDACTVAPPNRF